MTAVQADVRFCGLCQIFWIRAVVHHSEVLGCRPGCCWSW
jgi:hypothetical protein